MNEEESIKNEAEEIPQEPNKLKSLLKKLPIKNYWVFSTIALAIILIIVLISKGGVTGGAIGVNEAGQKLLDFANAQGMENIEVVDVKDQGSTYQVILSMDGEQVPIYVTKDGKYIASQLIPLEIKTETPQNIPKSDKPNIELFVMSYCPYGTQIEKGILPVVNLLKDKIDFKIKFVYYVMHGEQEVKEQLNQYCIQKEQPDKYLDYLTCFLEAGDSQSCLTQTGIDTAKLQTCTDSTDKQFNIMKNLNDQSSWLNGRYPLFDIYKNDNEKYDVGGSPTLIINGQKVSSGRDPSSLLNTICSAFNTAPEECSQTLSSSTPTPGFGWEGTGSNNAATCG